MKVPAGKTNVGAAAGVPPAAWMADVSDATWASSWALIAWTIDRARPENRAGTAPCV